MTEQDKERIEKEAEVYVFNHIHDAFGLSRQECYIAGYERAQQELQAYRDIIKELLPLAEENVYLLTDRSNGSRSKQIIDTVTPTI